MKTLYVTTISETMNFFPAHIRMLQNAGHTVELACNLDEPLPERVAELGCTAHHIPFSRSPFSKDNWTAYGVLKKLLNENQYDIVHTHTPNASALVRLACRKLRKNGTRVFYTPHGFHFYTGAPLKNWLIYYPVERFLSRWTDVLITINNEDYQRATRAFHAKKTMYVPGVGMDIRVFQKNVVPGERRAELGVSQQTLLLLSVGELNQNKNHVTILKALTLLPYLDFRYVICGDGIKRKELEQTVRKLGLSQKASLLGTRSDVACWMADADIYLFPSYREGLSVSLMEAMAAGLPTVCSDIRGNRDLIESERGGFLCRPDDADGFARAIHELADDPTLRAVMGRYNQYKVKKFSTERVLDELREIYGVGVNEQ